MLALTAGAATRVYVNTIQGGAAKIRPGAISVGQGQYTPYFSGPRWSRWGGSTARATGRVTHREPDLEAGESCGSAPDIVQRVTVTLSRRTTCRARKYYRSLKSSATARAFSLDLRELPGLTGAAGDRGR